MKLNFWMYIRQGKKNDFHSETEISKKKELLLYDALFFGNPFSISVTCSLFLPLPILTGLFIYIEKLLLIQKLTSSSKCKYVLEEDKGGQSRFISVSQEVSSCAQLMLSRGHSSVWELWPAQDLTQESHHCLHHTSKRGWAHSLQIHAQKLFQSSASAEPVEAWSSHEAATMHPSTLHWTWKGFEKELVFYLLPLRHTWQLPPRSTRLSCVCEATCCFLRVLGWRRAARPRESAPALGQVGTAGKQLFWEKGRAERKHRAGAVASLGSARSCAGEEQAEKYWAWFIFI